MRTFLKKLSSHNTLANSIIMQSMKLRNRVIPLKLRMEQRFFRKLGYKLNLSNPKSFNEKIQWLKLNDRSSLHTICADKYAVRNYVEEKIGKKYLIPLILQTTNVSDLVIENMPDFPVIIKTNHDSSGGEFIWKKDTTDWLKLQEVFKSRMNINYESDFGKGEWQYKNIPPCVIVEKILIDENGEIPSDYKMHCFNGKLAFIQVDMDRSTHHKRILYDTEWVPMNFQWAYDKGYEVPKPKVFEEMILIAEKFAKDFIYVRVDLYVIDKKIYFGELTFHSDSGNGKFIPEEWDFKIGEQLKLPN